MFYLEANKKQGFIKRISNFNNNAILFLLKCDKIDETVILINFLNSCFD